MKNILALLYITLFMISCSSGFNPRYYYEKGKRGGLSSSPVIKPVEAPTEVEADKDPFKVGEWNDPNYQFEARKFDSWLFKASFQKDKLPIYNFLTNDSRQWIPGGKDWNNISPAYYYNPKDKENEASGYGITGSTIYKYEGYNPLYDNSGYLPGRMDRFRFYSLYGKAVIVDLQQYLIAVDTYSKLVFAFGKITETKSTFGELVPMKFEAIEYHGDKDFYEYDPIGYVNSDGEVVLYEHYRTEFVKNPTGYLPKQHSFNTVATYTPNGQGYSPYAVLTSGDENDEKTFLNSIRDFNNKTFVYRDYSGYNGYINNQIDLQKWKANNYSKRSHKLYTYNITDGGKKIEFITTEYKKTAKTVETYTYKNMDGKTKAIYEYNGKTVSVSLIEVNGKNSISFAGRELDPDFIDYGPIFTDRVLGAKFENKKGTDKYEFSEDGTEFTLISDSKSWKYVLACFDNKLSQQFTAIYQCDGGKYGRVVLRDDDNTIKTSTVLSYIGALGTGDLDWGLGYEAYRVQQFAPDADKFKETVKSRIYEVRNPNNSLLLNRYTFSDDGLTILYEEIDWYTDKAVNTQTFTSYEKIDDTQAKYNGTVFSIQNDELKNNNANAGYYKYQDPGPYIYDVVKGKTYVRTTKPFLGIGKEKKELYKFDSTGKVVEYYVDGKLDTTYDFSQVKDDNHLLSAYLDRSKFGVVARYWGVKVEKDSKDTKLWVSTGSLGTANDILKSGGYGDPYNKE